MRLQIARVTAVVLAPSVRGSLPWIAATVSVAVVTALRTVGVVLNKPGKQELASHTLVEQKLANVTSVAEAVQRALLPPLPRRIGPLEFEVVYLAAAAEARVGGDLYEVARTQFGIRLIVGDARGEQGIVSLAEIAEPANGICWPWPWERAAEAENGARYSRGSSRSTRTRHSPRADATSLARCGPPPTPTELPDLDGRHTDPLSRRRPGNQAVI